MHFCVGNGRHYILYLKDILIFKYGKAHRASFHRLWSATEEVLSYAHHAAIEIQGMHKILCLQQWAWTLKMWPPPRPVNLIYRRPPFPRQPSVGTQYDRKGYSFIKPVTSRWPPFRRLQTGMVQPQSYLANDTTVELQEWLLRGIWKQEENHELKP